MWPPAYPHDGILLNFDPSHGEKPILSLTRDLVTDVRPTLHIFKKSARFLQAFYCKMGTFVHVHKLTIGARASNDVCYVASRNRLNSLNAILFKNCYLQEFATPLGGNFYV